MSELVLGDTRVRVVDPGLPERADSGRVGLAQHRPGDDHDRGGVEEGGAIDTLNVATPAAAEFSHVVTDWKTSVRSVEFGAVCVELPDGITTIFCGPVTPWM